MSINNADLVRDMTRRETIKKLAGAEAEHGKTVAGLMIEGILEGCAAYLKGSIGAEAAYNAVQRCADTMSADVVQHAARHQ